MADGRTKTGKLINQLSGNNFSSPAVENRTPIASDMWLPNHSGISSHPEMLGDNGFVKKSGDTMTGTLNAPTVNVTTSFTINGVNLFVRDNTWSGDQIWTGRRNTIYANKDDYIFSFFDRANNDVRVLFDADDGTPGEISYAHSQFGFSTNVSINGQLDVSVVNAGSVVYQSATITTPTRALNTVYKNTTGHSIVVMGSCNCLITDNASADLSYFDCQTGASNPPTTLNMRGGYIASINLVVANSGYIVNFPFNFEVPAGHYYRILPTVTGAGAVVLDTWRETNK